MQFNISKEHARCSGIYIIRNTINHKVYVGSAKTLLYRCRSHYSSLVNKNHSLLFQNFVNKYGIDCLYMELLELVPDINNLLIREQHYIDIYKCSDRQHGFNTNPLAKSRLGSKTAEETLKKLRGRKRSDEAKLKMSLAKLGKPRVMSEEGLKSFLEKARNRVDTPFTKRKKKESKQGEKNGCSKVTEADVLRIRKMYHTMSYGAIAKHFAITHLNVRHIVKGNTWGHLPLEDYSKRRRSEIEYIHRDIKTSKGTILTVSDVLNIRQLYFSYTHKQIAALYGLSRRQTGDIINGITWQHLPICEYKKPIKNIKKISQLTFHF